MQKSLEIDDRVKRINSNNMHVKIGEFGTITKVNDIGYYVKWDKDSNINGIHFHNNLEKLYEDFKIGDKVRGIRYDICGSEGIIEADTEQGYHIRLTKTGNQSWNINNPQWSVGNLISYSHWRGSLVLIEKNKNKYKYKYELINTFTAFDMAKTKPPILEFANVIDKMGWDKVVTKNNFDDFIQEMTGLAGFDSCHLNYLVKNGFIKKASLDIPKCEKGKKIIVYNDKSRYRFIITLVNDKYNTFNYVNVDSGNMIVNQHLTNWNNWFSEKGCGWKAYIVDNWD